MRTCREISKLLSEAQERPLGPAERLGVMLHLLVCKGCTQFRAQLEFLRRAMRRLRDADEVR